ncbi:MAG: thiamine pyrophosphate-dependent enzyme [Betaproteobacteria bacterium]|jgi:thiamine pyrophosphate-dependent acetolactate synthase large subunit-like protein
MAKSKKSTLDRREVVKTILAQRQDALLVTGLGSSCYDAGTVDHPNTFYLWGGMGGAAMIGLGLALAQPKRRVLVITGDGEMLMGLGSLATIAVAKASNLTILVIDNELYSETGMQPTHTSQGVDLAGIAAASGFKHAKTLHSLSEVKDSMTTIYKTPGPVFLDIKVNANRYPLSIRLRDGTHIKNRFRESVLGAKAFD